MADRPGGFEFAASPEAPGFDSAGINRLRSCMSGMVAGMIERAADIALMFQPEDSK